MRLARRTTSACSVPSPTSKRTSPPRRPTGGSQRAACEPGEVRRAPAEAGEVAGAECQVLQASANARPVAARSGPLLELLAGGHLKLGVLDPSGGWAAPSRAVACSLCDWGRHCAFDA